LYGEEDREQHPREGKPCPSHTANRIAGETQRETLSNHAIRDGQEHAREDIMTDILRAVQHIDAACALIRAGYCLGANAGGE
jgi:hypothetical protein